MGFDKPFVKRALAKPGHVTNLLRIKGDCYTKIGDLKAEAIKSDEPIAFADLDKSAFKRSANGKSGLTSSAARGSASPARCRKRARTSTSFCASNCRARGL